MSITVQILYILLRDRLKSDYMNLIDELNAEIRIVPQGSAKLKEEMLFLEEHQREAFELIDNWDWEAGVDVLLERTLERTIGHLRIRHPVSELPIEREKRIRSLRIEVLAGSLRDYVNRKGGKQVSLPIQEAEAIYNMIIKEG